MNQALYTHMNNKRKKKKRKKKKNFVYKHTNNASVMAMGGNTKASTLQNGSIKAPRLPLQERVIQ
jgi:hypothetical protein